MHLQTKLKVMTSLIYVFIGCYRLAWMWGLPVRNMVSEPNRDVQCILRKITCEPVFFQIFSNIQVIFKTFDTNIIFL
jgi:hypothetical protein